MLKSNRGIKDDLFFLTREQIYTFVIESCNGNVHDYMCNIPQLERLSNIIHEEYLKDRKE